MSVAGPTRELLAIYGHPQGAANLSDLRWADVLGATRRSRTLGHLWLALERAAARPAPDSRALVHFASIQVVVADRRRRMRRELLELAALARGLETPVVLLKGAAYEALGLPLARARVASDIDVLVPAASLKQFEQGLLAHGWDAKELDPYDERYYRDWSHELPPFVHPERGMEVDVHHALTPAMRGLGVDTGKLLSASIPVEWRGTRCFRVLQPVDQLIHCALHTFKDSDLDLRLRETMDFDILWQHYAKERPEALARALVARAIDLGQERALWWAIHFARRWLDSPIPKAALDALPAPAPAAIRAMNWLCDRAMLPGPRMERGGLDRLAAVLLLARYHYQRLPLTKLVPHLLEKSRRRLAHSMAEPDAP